MAEKPALDFWCYSSTDPMVKPHASSAGRVPQEDTGRASRQNGLSDIWRLHTMMCLRFSRVGLYRRIDIVCIGAASYSVHDGMLQQ